MAATNNVVYDVNGYDIVTKAIQTLINQYPGLGANDEILFAESNTEEGISFFPVSGAIIQTEVKDVTGHVSQTCMYPFIVVYKSGGLSEKNKISIKEWLDNLGRWLEKQIIEVNNTEYKLEDYPPMNNQMDFTQIKRTSPSFLMQTTTDKVDTWSINITAYYKSEFDIE